MVSALLRRLTRNLRAGRALSRLALACQVAACLRAQPPATASPASSPVASATAARPSSSATLTPAAAVKELPGGGRVLFPDHRLVGFCGTPGGPALGELHGNLPVKAKALEAQAAQYARGGRQILPVFELIAVVVMAGPGVDGKSRHRVDGAVVDEYLQLARRSKGLLLLNIQPGHSDFVTEVKSFEEYLREPDVGVALDPEWAMKPKQQPGVYYGQTTGAILNEVGEYLSKLIAEGDLPEKALVFHQVNRLVLKDESVVVTHPGVALIKSVDGLGPMPAKIATYATLMETMPAGVHPGFKLFFDEDRRGGNRLMTPVQVLALSPPPEYIMYE